MTSTRPLAYIVLVRETQADAEQSGQQKGDKMTASQNITTESRYYGEDHDYRDEERCFYCGTKCHSGSEPVTVGGWYEEIEYRWYAGQILVSRCICWDCKVAHPHYDCDEDEHGAHYPSLSCPDVE